MRAPHAKGSGGAHRWPQEQGRSKGRKDCPEEETPGLSSDSYVEISWERKDQRSFHVEERHLRKV